MDSNEKQPAIPPSTKDLLGSGGGAPSAKFPSIGSSVGGVVTKTKVSQQTDMATGDEKFWPDGQPKWQIEVTVLTDERDPDVEDDDGSRRIYVKGYMTNAVNEAVSDAGALDVEKGGTLTVTYVDDKPSSTRGYSPAKLYQAKYESPTGLTGFNVGAVSDEEPF